jgi:hypothetical protein
MNRKRLAVAVMAVGLWTGGAWAATTSIDATVTVTPVAALSLAIAPTTYAFGPLNVGAAASIATSSLTLRNSGTVSLTMTKAITTESSPAGWTAGGSAGPNQYVLEVTTAAAQAVTADFSAGTLLTTGAGNNLVPASGAQVTLLPQSGGGFYSTDMWFRLTMPTSVVDQTAREIKVTFTGTSN